MGSVEWRLHLDSPPEQVYRALSTDEGREAFWAESATESGGVIQFVFPNGAEMHSRILEARPDEQFVVEYFSGTAAFDLAPDGTGGTELTLCHEGLSLADEREASPGWVSVLLSLKAAVDHSIDLRNHDPTRTWDDGFVDN